MYYDTNIKLKNAIILNENLWNLLHQLKIRSRSKLKWKKSQLVTKSLWFREQDIDHNFSLFYVRNYDMLEIFYDKNFFIIFDWTLFDNRVFHVFQTKAHKL